MILGIVGPTGIGKSEVAICIARELPSYLPGRQAEIVVVDSMQVYRGMDLGTGKPPVSIRQEIPHHGLNLAEPEEDFHVARYAASVRPSIQSILDRGKLPILVGGSGLYLKVLLDGLCEAPGRSPEIRESLFRTIQEKGTSSLYGQLKAVDPESAGRIHPNDWKKIVRALEVFLTSGKPISQWQRQTTPFLEKPEGLFLFGLTCDRNLLYRRIEERIDGWIASGWLEEVQRLFLRPLSFTAREALGYRELFHLLEGRTDWERAVSLIKQKSRRYAKRQFTWFKTDPRVEWIETDGKTSQEIANEILARLKRPEGSLSGAPL